MIQLYHSALCCLSSAIVLLVDNLVRISAVVSPDLPTLDAHRKEGTDALASFAQLPTSNTMAQKALSVLTQLLEEEARRRALKGIPLPFDFNTPRCEARSLKESIDAIFLRRYVPTAGQQPAPSYALVGASSASTTGQSPATPSSYTAVPSSSDFQPEQDLFAQLGIQFPQDMAFEGSFQQDANESMHMSNFGYSFM